MQKKAENNQLRLSLCPSRLHNQSSVDSKQLIREMEIFQLTSGINSDYLKPKKSRRGEYDSSVVINNKKINFFKEEAVLKEALSKAWLKDRKPFSYELTENQIDRIVKNPVNVREAEPFNDEGKFKIRLENYIKNTGRTLPHDSHPSFYNDHYDSAVKFRQATTFDDQSI